VQNKLEKTIGEKLKEIDNLRYYDVSDKNPLMVKLRISDKRKLYHYTSLESGKNILKSSSFWVTRCDGLDDKTEIKYISHVLNGVIMYFEQNKDLYCIRAKEKYTIIEIIIRTLKALSDMYKKGAPIIGANLYLLSLSENKNNKYLKENYCRNNGIILEFKNDIQELFGSDDKIHVKLTAKVEYSYRKQMELIIEDINEFFSEFLANLINEREVNFVDIFETIRTVIYTKVINYSFFFKNEYFSEEEEYRVAFIVKDNNSMIKYRMKSGRPISYIVANIKNKNMISKRYV